MATELVTREIGAATLHTENDFSISGETVDLMRDESAPRTVTEYQGQWRRFTEWCASEGRTAMPATPQTCVEFVKHLADRELSPSTIGVCLSAVLFMHTWSGMPRPDMEAAWKAVRGYKNRRAQARQNKRKQSAPVTLEPLRAMVDVTGGTTLAGMRDRVILVLGYGGMMRRSELAGLRIEDVTLTDDGVQVWLPTHKTDKAREGASINIPRGVHAATDPHRVVSAWLSALAERGVTAGPLLRRVRRGDVLDPAGLTAKGLNDVVKRLADKAGQTGITAHGLRAGAPTDAAKAGVPTALIAEHGRWSKNSTQVMTYVRSADKWRDNPVRGLGL